jgi:hypothetical protein
MNETNLIVYKRAMIVEINGIRELVISAQTLIAQIGHLFALFRLLNSHVYGQLIVKNFPLTFPTSHTTIHTSTIIAQCCVYFVGAM